MDITNRQMNDVVIVHPTGSIDTSTAPELGTHLDSLMAHGDASLVLDFSSVDYTSSAGLRVLLGAAKQSREKGGDLRLASVPPDVLKVLSLSGFTNILKIFDDAHAAVASFS